MDEIYNASATIQTCTQDHVHIRMRSLDNDCPMLDTVFEPDEARQFACALLEAAASLRPVS